MIERSGRAKARRCVRGASARMSVKAVVEEFSLHGAGSARDVDGLRIEAGVPARLDGGQWNSVSYCSDFGLETFRALMPGWEECPFSVWHHDRPLLAVHCTRTEAGIGLYKLPLLPASLAETDADLTLAALRIVFDQLEGLALDTDGATARIWNQSPVLEHSTGGLVDDLCRSWGGASKPWVRAVADLSLSEAQLKADIRSSYKSLLNWGKREIAIELSGGPDLDEDALAAYAGLYAGVSGKTLPDSYWTTVGREIRENRGEIMLGALGGQRVLGSIFIDSGPVTHYFSAAYDRTHFDKPLSHWPLFLGMLRAKERGQRWFDLGEVESPDVARGDKEAQIAFFKKGFTSRLAQATEWVVPFVSDRVSGFMPDLVDNV